MALHCQAGKPFSLLISFCTADRISPGVTRDKSSVCTLETSIVQKSASDVLEGAVPQEADVCTLLDAGLSGGVRTTSAYVDGVTVLRVAHFSCSVTRFNSSLCQVLLVLICEYTPVLVG